MSKNSVLSKTASGPGTQTMRTIKKQNGTNKKRRHAKIWVSSTTCRRCKKYIFNINNNLGIATDLDSLLKELL